MKKIITYVFALLLVGGAAQAQTVTVADVEALRGETVSFAISIQNGKANKYTALGFDVQFPTTGFTTTGLYTLSSSWPNAAGNVGEVGIFGDGLARVGFYSSSEISGSSIDNLATVEFTVANNVDYGTYDVELKDITFEYNTSDKDVAPNVTFKVNVVEKHSVVLDENSTTAPTAAANVNVMVKRTINAGEWSTIVLPFAMTETQVKAAFGNDVELADFAGYETTEDGDNNIVGITINFNDNVTAIEANHPYIIKVSSAITEFTVADVDIAPEAEPSVSFGYTTGSKPKVYHPKDFNGTFVADFDFYNAATSYPLFLSGNKIYYATLSTQHMKAFRAYFDFDDVLAEVENASARITMAFDDSGTTGISTIGYKTNDGEYYNLQGMPVEKPTRGLYIHNGRKVIIK